MKITRQRTQFDHPLSVGTPATPSCCCCCCCCLATIVSTVSIGAITAQHEAKRFDRRSGWPILLAIIAVPIGFFASGFFVSMTGEGAVGVIGGALAALVLWYFAFHLAAPESETSAVGRSFKYLVLFAVFFAVELVLGFFLVILYVVPYLIVAGLVTFFVIRSHLQSQRKSLPANMPPPPAWKPPPPPPGTPASRPTTMLSADQLGNALGPGGDGAGPPAAWPPRSDVQSSSASSASPSGSGSGFALPPTSDVSAYEPPAPGPQTPPPPSGTPSFEPAAPVPPAPATGPGFEPPSFEPPSLEPPSFEPPSEYQLPGYPAAPPQAPDTGQPPPTYRPGNPASQPGPPDEKA